MYNFATKGAGDLQLAMQLEDRVKIGTVLVTEGGTARALVTGRTALGMQDGKIIVQYQARRFLKDGSLAVEPKYIGKGKWLVEGTQDVAWEATT